MKFTHLAGVLIGSAMIAAPASAAVIYQSGETPLHQVIQNVTCDPGQPIGLNCTTPYAIPGFTDSLANLNASQYGPDQVWGITGTGGSVATLIIEIAGNAGSNTMGIYDVSNPNNYVTMFGGPAGAGAQAFVSLTNTGEVRLNGSLTGVFFADNAFGFFLGTGANGTPTFFSQMSRNQGGYDQFVAFAGNNVNYIALPGVSAGLWTDSEFIMAFEDTVALCGQPSDCDYNDFVFSVESVIGRVPEPGSLALLGLGLIGLGAVRRRHAA